MKLNRFFMLGLAGLAFAACSNDDEPGQTPVYVENGAVSVKIVKPAITKALSPDGTVDIKGKLTVTLVGKTAKDKDENDYRETIVIDVDQLAAVQYLTFWNIAVPDSLIASINDGALSYEKDFADKDEKLQLKNLWGVAPESAPAYGVTTKFVLNGGTGSPDLSNDNDGTNDKPEAGAEPGDDKKVYDKYTATVTMAIPMARLEVGTITYKAPNEPDAEPIYATLIYTGSYLDKYVTYGTKYNEDEGAFPASSETVGNYWFEAGAGAAGQAESLMKFPASGTPDFLTTPIQEGGCFNFFAAGENPQFKLYFKDGTMNPESGTVLDFPRYAMITKYMKDGQEVTMENGHIYKIISMELDEPHFIPNEDGGTTYGVVVTIEEAQWQVESVSGVWGE